MWNQSVERHTGLRIEVPADEKLEWSAIAAVELELVRPIVRQTSVSVGEQALKVEQRSDVRVRLPVVITEEAFVVSNQAREHVRSNELEIVRKSLRCGELDSAIETLSASKALRRARRIGRWITSTGIFFSCARSDTTRIEDEVGVTVVERTVFDNVDHGAVSAPSAEHHVAANFKLGASRVLTNALRLQTDIGRSRISAEIDSASADTRKNPSAGRCVQPIDVEVFICLNIATAGADVDVQRNRGFDELRVVSKDLAFAFTGEIPDEAEARRSVIVEVVELQIRAVVVAIGLLVIPTDAKAQLEVLREFPVVTDVEAFHVGIGSTDELEDTNARGIPDDERIIERFRCTEVVHRRPVNRQAQTRQSRSRDCLRADNTRLARARNFGPADRAD